ncbi:hypothetical protein BDZ90DRAFT_56197 [Jaminaea rosea]|uniref:WW domain-containing protein n=1 Tax=Jaminaea rosea TaxID=1569628 RepID=A0A316UM18_9BASI|nr:hypothetical protein BDZ90DRAFT_56197 [Jaminaea rosea]PWN25994.1 hypothetical protein BDZ90DRAFT_56197 [Jaminaea rosea]
MASVPLLFSLLLLPISSFFLWLPWSTHVAFFHPPEPSSFASSASSHLNLDSCRPLPSGPEWCAEPVIHSASRLAYFHCDDSRPWWDPPSQTWEALPQGKKGGSIWVWDLKDSTSQPKQLELHQPTSRQGEVIHPLSLSVVSSKNDPATNVLLVSNHPHARSAGVVDVYRHDVNLYHAVQYDRISGHALKSMNPYRIDAVREQWSLPVEAPKDVRGEVASDDEPAPLPLGPMEVPSFIFTSLATPECVAAGPEEEEKERGGKISSAAPACPRRPGRSTSPSLPQYLLDVLPLPSFIRSSSPYSPSPPRTISQYVALSHSTRPIFDTLASHPSAPPLLRAWDGGGVAGGSNTSLPHIYVGVNSAKMALLEQWDQHWVKGPAAGAELIPDGRTYRDVLARWGSFVTFWSAPLRGSGGEEDGASAGAPVLGMDVDSFGRVWTVGPLSMGRVVKRIEELRRRRGVEEEDKDDAELSPSPGALVRQTTYVHRLGAAIGHPWEVERLARAKKRGIWLPKQFFSTVVYRLGLTSPAASAGYLPGAPTGVAVDEEGRRVIITSSWERRGAVCEFKEGWVEEQGE